MSGGSSSSGGGDSSEGDSGNGIPDDGISDGRQSEACERMTALAWRSPWPVAPPAKGAAPLSKGAAPLPKAAGRESGAASPITSVCQALMSSAAGLGLVCAQDDTVSEEMAADWADITSTLAGDGQAFSRLVRRYQDRVTAQMWRLSRQRNDCEQLVHEVFVEAYLSLKQYKGRAPFLHWLRKIATRVGYRYWKQRDRARRQATVPIQDWHRSTTDAEPGEAQETASLVHETLAKLPPRDRLVLTLIYLEGCSVAEAAEMSGWSQTMVKVQAHRARKKLKKLLGDEPP